MKRTILALVAAAMVVLSAAGADARNAVTGMRLGSHPDGITRFVMDLADNLDFTVAPVANPDRIVITAPSLAWSAAPARPYGSVGGVRYEDGQASGRIVLELKSPALVKSAFTIPPRDGQGWRFVMDLRQVTQAAFVAEAKAAVKPVAVAQVPAKPVQPAAAPARLAEPAKPAAADPAPAPAPSQRLVIYSPEVTPAPVAVAAAPAAAPAPAAAAPVLADTSKPAKAAKAARVMMSAPVPPPLERPSSPAAVGAPAAPPAVVAPAAPPAMPAIAAAPPAMPAIAAAPPPPAPAPAITKAAAPLPAPDYDAKGAEPKAYPGDGKPVIVIDPGHGGVDPGAIGVSGIYEKNITLAVARELKAELEKKGRYKVHLTRDRDVFIRLRERVAIGRQHGADLFISLHADSVANPQLKGLSVYTLSQNASDSEAQALADKENKADLIAGIDLSHESADVANILIDLAQRETMNRSAAFAGGMVDEVGRETQLLGNTHRFAGFAVLKAPDVPSVLVELGYLSNDTEERNLRSPEYRGKLAKAISRSVDRFFLQGQKAKRP